MRQYSKISTMALAIALITFTVWTLSQNAFDTGLGIDDDVPSYNPIHIAGPDKNTNTCPP